MTGSPVPAKAREDVLRCAAMMSECSPWVEQGYTFERCVEDLSHPCVGLWVVRDAGGIAGFIAVLQPGFGFEPLVEYICVRSDARGRGIGSGMLGWVERRYERVYLTVTETNRARWLYERRGWELVGALPDHEERGVAELVMRWQINHEG